VQLSAPGRALHFSRPFSLLRALTASDL
jgi:hypothetical protein